MDYYHLFYYDITVLKMAVKAGWTVLQDIYVIWSYVFIALCIEWKQ